MPASRRNDLIDAAMRVFYQHGFHASGLEKILQEGSLSRMTLYNHFKSKDELILAALRRRDELFRNRMMKFVESHATAPVQRLLAVFDFLEHWFAEKDFCGCMFINASAEYGDPESPIRQLAAEHKRTIRRYLAELCEQADADDPAELAEELSLLIEGATVTARVVGQVTDNATSGSTSSINAARRAKRIASQLIEPMVAKGKSTQ